MPTIVNSAPSHRQALTHSGRPANSLAPLASCGLRGSSVISSSKLYIGLPEFFSDLLSFNSTSAMRRWYQPRGRSPRTRGFSAARSETLILIAMRFPCLLVWLSVSGARAAGQRLPHLRHGWVDDLAHVVEDPRTRPRLNLTVTGRDQDALRVRLRRGGFHRQVQQVVDHPADLVLQLTDQHGLLLPPLGPLVLLTRGV